MQENPRGRGFETTPANSDNGDMSRSIRPFTHSQVFDWEVEPQDERPSEFVPSTGYATLSGYHVMPETRGREVRSGSSLNLVLVVGAVFVALGAAALIGFLHMIRA